MGQRRLRPLTETVMRLGSRQGRVGHADPSTEQEMEVAL